MYSLNSQASLAGLLAFSLIFLGFSALASSPTPGEVRTDCVDAPQISDAKIFQGRGEIRLNDEGTLLLALDSTGNSRADVLFRVATHRNEPALQAALESSREGQSFMVLQRDGIEYHELEISGLDGDPEAMLFVMDRRECAPNRMPSEIVGSRARMPAMAVSRETSREWDQSPLQLVSDRMDDPVIIRQSESTSHSDAQQRSEGPWCMSGGEGAVAASLSFDEPSPIPAGEHWLECGGFPGYACCRPTRSGARCECIAPAQSSSETP